MKSHTHSIDGRWPKAMIATALGVTVAFGATACAGGSTAQTGGTPTPGGSITVAQGTEPTCLDPVIGSAGMNTGLLAAQYLESLVTQDDTGAVIPWLASGWTVADDGLSYDFTLRDDVVFTDGAKLDADAVKKNVDRILAVDGGAGGRAAIMLTFVDSVEVVDDKTVRFVLSQPYSPFLEVIAQPFLGMQSPAAIARSVDENCVAPVGTGPFIVDKYEPGSAVTLIKNAQYNTAPAWAANQSAAYIDEIEWRFIPDATTRFGAVTSGQADISDGALAVNEVSAKNNASIEIRSHDYPGVPVGLTLNIARAPFNDPLVREAFLSSMDIDAAIQSALLGTYGRTGFLSPTTPFVDDQWVNGTPFDQQKANDLLDQAGWTDRDAQGYRTKDGTRLSAKWLYYLAPEFDSYGTMAEQFQASAREVGIEIILAPEPLATVFQTLSQPVIDADIFLNLVTLNSPDALRQVFSTGSIGTPGYNLNPAGISDPGIDKALEIATATTDTGVRKENYDAVQRLLVERHYGANLFTQAARYAVNTGGIQGVSGDPTFGLLDLRGAWVN